MSALEPVFFMSRRLGAAARRPWLLSLVPVLAMVAAWEVAARAGAVPVLFFPAPSRIFATVVRLAAEGVLAVHLGATVGRTLLGALLGCAPAAFVGLAMGWSPRVRAALDPIVAALHPLPKIALLPLMMVLFGVGETSRVAAVATGAFFPMLLSAAAGVRQISPIHFEVVRSYGGSRRKLFSRVVLPGALPLLLTGLRLSLNLALLIAIAVELVAAEQGLGRLLWIAWETQRTDQLWAGLVVIAALGVGINVSLAVLARRLVLWQRDAAA